jgi:CheY-like chemotaxis protein
MGRQIVLVDDDIDILRILSEVLRGDGYDPIPFVSPVRAFEYCCTTRPALVITDLLMPVMSGQKLVLRLRERYSDGLPIVVMSASVNMAAVADLPVEAFVSKPFDIDEFLDLLQRLLLTAPEVAHVGASPPAW